MGCVSVVAGPGLIVSSNDALVLTHGAGNLQLIQMSDAQNNHLAEMESSCSARQFDLLCVALNIL